MNILQEIAERTKKRVMEQKEVLPLSTLINRLESQPDTFASKTNRTTSPLGTPTVPLDTPIVPLDTSILPFEKALQGEDISFICEVKRASPSQGLITSDFPYIEIAKDYERAGAAAISVLTEPFYFKGENRYLSEIAKEVSIPILRKDFVVDEYMIYEAKELGAHAVLLICAILDERKLTRYIDICMKIGLCALVEAHSEEEVKMALTAGAQIIGVNNRNLKTFDVDIELSMRLREMVPPDVLFISESGIRSAKDIMNLRNHHVDGVLIGETLMRASDRRKALAQLRGDAS